MLQLPKGLPGVKACCEVAENLELKEETGDLKTFVCKDCQCKHRRFKADMGKLGAILSGLGKPKPAPH